MRFAFFFLLVIFSYNAVFAQSILISGVVKNTEGELLAEANIINNTSLDGASTNKKGIYSMEINTPQIDLSVSFIGHVTINIKGYALNDTVINFILPKKINLLPEAEVSVEKDVEKAQSVMSLPIKLITRLPSLGGEKDLIKALSFVPGVQTGAEGTTGIYVRGGEGNQNLIVLDRIPFYNVSHAFGYMSVFDADMAKSIEIMKGGFPANYGGKLSSIIKINPKNGSSDSVLYKYSIGLVASKLFLEIPVKKNTHILFSVRKTYLDAILRSYNYLKNPNSSSGVYISFYDVNFRVTSKLYKKNSIYYNFYLGDDKLSYEQNYRIEGKKERTLAKLQSGNIVSSITSKHVFSKNSYLYFVTGFTRYRQSQIAEITSLDNDTEEDISDVYFKTQNFIFDYNNRVEYRFNKQYFTTLIGVEQIYHNYIPFAIYIEKGSVPFSEEKYKPKEYAVFLENKLSFGKFIVNTGIRYANYQLRETRYKYFEPRISAKLIASNNITIKGTYTKMNQFNHLLNNISTGMSGDIWFPATAQISPQSSEQFSVGIIKSNLFAFVNIGIEAYYKTMSGLIAFSDQAYDIMNIESSENSLEIDGKGKSKGIEFFARMDMNTLSSGIAYTLSKTDRQFLNINGGKPYPFKYDRRHNISTYLTWEVSSKISLSASWTYMTGAAFTLPAGRYYPYSLINENAPTLLIFTERNQYRMPPFHKLDLSIQHRKKKKRGVRTFELSIYNSYNRQNAYFISLHPDYQNGVLTEPKIWQNSMLPLLPSLSYSFEF